MNKKAEVTENVEYSDSDDSLLSESETDLKLDFDDDNLDIDDLDIDALPLSSLSSRNGKERVGLTENGVNNFQTRRNRFTKNCKCPSKKVVALIFTIILVSVISSLCFWVFATNGHYARAIYHYFFGYNTDAFDSHGKPNYRVCFIGDSLILRTDRKSDFINTIVSRLHKKYPKYNFIPIESAFDGNRILDIRNRMDRDCFDYQPHSAIIYYDSDASDTSPGEDSKTYRARYHENLDFVLAKFEERMPGRVALGGPTLLGEKTRGTNERDSKCDEPGGYDEMNREGAKAHNVTYIETRNEFFSHLPKGFDKNCCYLTIDGEHHNDKGAAIVTELFYNVLDGFYANLSPPS